MAMTTGGWTAVAVASVSALAVGAYGVTRLKPTPQTVPTQATTTPTTTPESLALASVSLTVGG